MYTFVRDNNDTHVYNDGVWLRSTGEPCTVNKINATTISINVGSQSFMQFNIGSIELIDGEPPAATIDEIGVQLKKCFRAFSDAGGGDNPSPAAFETMKEFSGDGLTDTILIPHGFTSDQFNPDTQMIRWKTFLNTKSLTTNLQSRILSSDETNLIIMFPTGFVPVPGENAEWTIIVDVIDK